MRESSFQNGHGRRRGATTVAAVLALGASIMVVGGCAEDVGSTPGGDEPSTLGTAVQAVRTTALSAAQVNAPNSTSVSN